jgi:hypothetical protein
MNNMKNNPIESIETEDGILFNVLKVNVKSTELYSPFDYPMKIGYYKIIFKIDDRITKTHYFKNGVETSKDKILQEERIKSLRR